MTRHRDKPPEEPAEPMLARHDERPENRAECRDGYRPCPYVSCKFHLYVDVNPNTGAIKRNFPGTEVWDMAETCALDVADRGEHTLKQVGEILSLTRERIRQMEVKALRHLGIRAPREAE